MTEPEQVDTKRFAISLVGAAGSGKTALAEALRNKVDGPTLIVDDYAQYVADELNIAVGIWGNHLVNNLIYMKRFEAEQFALQSGKSWITCGSEIESMIYSAYYVENLQRQIQTPQTENALARAQTSLMLHSFYLADYFRKSFVYFLPKPDKVIVVGQDTDPNENFNADIDSRLRQFVLTLPINIPMLTGTLDEKVSRIMEDIEKLPEQVGEDDDSGEEAEEA